MSSPSRTLLLVEDDELLRAVTAKSLRSAGYEVVGCADGEEALRCLDSVRPDAIISDVSMPGMDGLELLRRVRATPRGGTLPFIIMSARGDHADQRMGMSLGADDYIAKPFQAADLLRTLELRLERATLLEGITRDHQAFLSRVLPHELRTPLTGIIGYAELMVQTAKAKRTLPVTDLGEYGQSILKAGMRLLRMAEDFGLWSELESVAARLRQGEPVKRVAASISAPDFEDRCRRVAVDFGREPDLEVELATATVSVPVRAVEQVLLHLVENAFAFSEPGGRVRVEGRKEGALYRFTVGDSGRGMTPDQIQRIGGLRQFGREIYEQQGIGLGLALAARLAGLSGGEFMVEPNTGGVGLRVSLTLPLADAGTPVVLREEMPGRRG